MTLDVIDYHPLIVYHCYRYGITQQTSRFAHQQGTPLWTLLEQGDIGRRDSLSLRQNQTTPYLAPCQERVPRNEEIPKEVWDHPIDFHLEVGPTARKGSGFFFALVPLRTTFSSQRRFKKNVFPENTIHSKTPSAKISL